MPGYKAQPVRADDVKEGMMCKHCKQLLRDPVQTEDGERTCRTCFEEILKLPEARCSDCNVSVVAGKSYPDKAILRQILRLIVVCLYSLTGCKWAGPLSEWEEHCKTCEYRNIRCPFVDCEEIVSPRELEQHKQACIHRPVSCDHCSQSLTYKQLKSHYEKDCTEFPVECADCSTVFPRQKIQQHQLEECKVETCRVCNSKVTRESAIERPEATPPLVHLSNPRDAFRHQQALALKHDNLAAQFSSVQTAIEAQDRASLGRASQEDLSALRMVTESLVAKVSKLESQFGENVAGSSKRFERLEKREKQMADKLQSQEKELVRLRKQCESVKGECEQNAQAIKRSSQPTRHRQQHSGSRLSPDCGDSQDTQDLRMTDIHKKLEDLTRENATIKHNISDLELQLQASLASTHNGSFLWRIPEFSKRRREAIEEKITSIYSPPFYTGRNGYKMCVRAYLNGDGMGYRTHLSLFFVIMKGEYDPLLKWPFDYKVSMILVDQSHRKHIVQTFKPTPESNSFMKPVSDMNVASGCPTFCKLSVFDEPDNDYMKGDVMFVKCIVDTTRIFHP